MHSSPSTLLSSLLTALLLSTPASSLGINCRGSGLCPMATWDNKSPLPIMQVMRDVLFQPKYPATIPFTSGSHILCVSDTLSLNLSLPLLDPTTGLGFGSWNLAGNLKNGGICLFPQNLKAESITLGEVRPLVDKLLEHGCGTCGSVPVHFVDRGSNDPGEGILTFNFVRSPYCTENCLTDGLSEGSNFTATIPAPGGSVGNANVNGKNWNGTEAVVGENSGVKARGWHWRVKREEREERTVASGDGAEGGEEEGGLRTRSAKFADLAKRGDDGGKGWIGWLRRRV